MEIECQYLTNNVCALGLFSGKPRASNCIGCIAAGENNTEYAERMLEIKFGKKSKKISNEDVTAEISQVDLVNQTKAFVQRLLKTDAEENDFPAELWALREDYLKNQVDKTCTNCALNKKLKNISDQAKRFLSESQPVDK